MYIVNSDLRFFLYGSFKNKYRFCRYTFFFYCLLVVIGRVYSNVNGGRDRIWGVLV